MCLQEWFLFNSMEWVRGNSKTAQRSEKGTVSTEICRRDRPRMAGRRYPEVSRYNLR